MTMHAGKLAPENWRLWRLFELLKCAGDKGMTDAEIRRWFEDRGRGIESIATWVSQVRKGAAVHGWRVPYSRKPERVTEDGTRIHRYYAVRLTVEEQAGQTMLKGVA